MIDEGKVFLTIGTDFHRFDRIIDWLDHWLEAHPEMGAHTVVQHGASRPSRLGRNVEFLPFDQLLALMESSAAVVVHGGPGSIFEARRAGRLPLCVPRDPELHEIVDAHQQKFARHLAQTDSVVLCETEDALHAALDRVAADPAAGRVDVDEVSGQEATRNVARIVRSLVADRVRRRANGVIG